MLGYCSEDDTRPIPCLLFQTSRHWRLGGFQDESHPNDTFRLITNVRAIGSDRDDDEFGWVFVGGPGTFTAPMKPSPSSEKPLQISPEI